RDATRLEEKAAIEVRTLEAAAEIGLGGYFVPHIGTRRRREIRERAIRRPLGPRAQGGELRHHLIIKQTGPLGASVLEALQADVVAPPLEHGKAHRLIVERALQEGEVLPNELLLQ